MKNILLVLMLSCSFSSWAVDVVGQHHDVYITNMNLGWGVKRVNLILSKPVPMAESTHSSLACKYSMKEVQADENLVNIDHFYSLALAAYIAKKPVQVYISETECSAGERMRAISIGM